MKEIMKGRKLKRQDMQKCIKKIVQQIYNQSTSKRIQPKLSEKDSLEN